LLLLVAAWIPKNSSLNLLNISAYTKVRDIAKS